MSKDIEFRLVAWPKFIWNATNLAHSLKLSPKQLKEVKTILRRRNNQWKKQLQVNSAEKHKNEHHRFIRLARWEALLHCPYHYSEMMFWWKQNVIDQRFNWCYASLEHWLNLCWTRVQQLLQCLWGLVRPIRRGPIGSSSGWRMNWCSPKVS